MSDISCTVTRQKWPINGQFRIARGSKTHAEVVYLEIKKGHIVGRGEAVPYAHYGENPKSVIKEIKSQFPKLKTGLNRLDLLHSMPAGAARNAIDAALWDIEAKEANQPPTLLASMGDPGPVLSCFTISLDTAEKMSKAALASQYHPLLKLKLGGGLENDRAAMLGVRRALPQHRLVIDANEGWTEGTVFPLLDTALECNIELVEQPLPSDQDDILVDLDHPVPICADESFHTIDDLETISAKYQAINIKIDKTGGLTHALAVHYAAKNAGLKIMIGCMVGTSLGMAPAMLLGQGPDIIDLDGPLWLTQDRDFGITYEGRRMYFPSADLWG